MAMPTSYAEVRVSESIRAREVDRLEILIKAIEKRPLTESERFILKDIDALMESELTQSPKGAETKLKLSERILLAKVLTTIVYRGLKGLVSSSLPEIGGASIGGNLKDLSEQELSQGELSILNFFASLVNRNALEPYLKSKLQLVAKIPVIGARFKKDPKGIDFIVQFASSNIYGLVKTRGLTKDSRSVVYEPWSAIVARQTKDIKAGKVPQYSMQGQGVVREFSYLVDGPESFQKRGELLNGARQSIDILVWAVQDDMTGAWLKDILLRKKAQGIKVRLIVDGDVAKRSGYGTTVNEMEKSGIEVIKWTHPEFQFVGQHRKMIIVDREFMVAGGLNFGDTYSHMNPAKSHWRDTDIYAAGEFVTEVAANYFDKIWNEAAPRFGGQKQATKALSSRVIKPTSSSSRSLGQGQIVMRLIDHSPENKTSADSNIYNSMIADIQNAQKSIDIANAYVIVTDAFIEAIRAAVQRGVRVRILTNSDQSVDEPTLGGAMMISAKKLVSVGAEVYLRTGTTYHSKFMVIDEHISHVTSYNLHPRSERMEGEVSFMIYSSEQGKKLAQVFEKDIGDESKARRVKNGKELKLKNDVMTWLLIRIMYDQL